MPLSGPCGSIIDFVLLVACCVVPHVSQANGQDSAKSQPPAAEKGGEAFEALPPPPNLQRMAPDFDIWIDQQQKRVLVDGKVVLRQGNLEMFACPRNTKEHESIVSVQCKARFVHAGLLAVGAEPGTPVQFDPVYKSATGPELEITVMWRDKKGEHQVRAQDWIQNAKTGKSMEFPFVFAGSGFHVDESTGEKYYLGDGGDLICVSNFTSATVDVGVESSQQNSALNFQAFTERIPPVGTAVRLILSAKKGPAPAAASSPEGSVPQATKKSPAKSASDAPKKAGTGQSA